jgi:hypothetical protein
MTAQTAAHGLNASVSSHQARLHLVHHQYSAQSRIASVAMKNREKKLMTCSAALGKIESLVFEKMASSQEISELSSSILLLRPLKVLQQQQQCESMEDRPKA